MLVDSGGSRKFGFRLTLSLKIVQSQTALECLSSLMQKHTCLSFNQSYVTANIHSTYPSQRSSQSKGGFQLRRMKLCWIHHWLMIMQLQSQLQLAWLLLLCFLFSPVQISQTCHQLVLQFTCTSRTSQLHQQNQLASCMHGHKINSFQLAKYSYASYIAGMQVTSLPVQSQSPLSSSHTPPLQFTHSDQLLMIALGGGVHYLE